MTREYIINKYQTLMSQTGSSFHKIVGIDVNHIDINEIKNPTFGEILYSTM